MHRKNRFNLSGEKGDFIDPLHPHTPAVPLVDFLGELRESPVDAAPHESRHSPVMILVVRFRGPERYSTQSCAVTPVRPIPEKRKKPF
ncbi:hypothetical protein CEXT_596311 [Caerostris extrusa]|uniref:Uncharacterized protein n=1 Tax=Caerostris extrusa TaxID=172846 RepID=A0AAV4TC83_CAEEX|nr:hypothetical protein CEXT_596311 [Caerostris extrusa]